jgi:hypothetical protein
MKLPIMQFCPTSHHLISLRSKYSPQHPVLKSNTHLVHNVERVKRNLNENHYN